jgi:phasin family protein
MKTIEEMVEFSRHSLDSTLQASTRAASTSYHHAVASTEEKIDAASAKRDEMASLNKNALKAAMQSSTILFDGMQELTRGWVGAVQESAQQAVDHGKALRGVKSVAELTRMNQDYAKNKLEKAVNDSTRLAEQSLTLAEQAAKPLTLHISETMIPQVNEQLSAILAEMIKQPH